MNHDTDKEIAMQRDPPSNAQVDLFALLFGRNSNANENPAELI
jgi:hypothetical protein